MVIIKNTIVGEYSVEIKMFYLLVLLTLVPLAAGSECCEGYYDILGNWKDPQWCDNYCCGTTEFKVGLSCCDDILLQAPSDDRDDFCDLWWKHHIWAPIVSAVVFIGIMICCCVCCYKCCCASNRTTVILQNPGMGGMGAPNISTTMVSSQNSVNSYNQPVHFDPIKY